MSKTRVSNPDAPESRRAVNGITFSTREELRESNYYTEDGERDVYSVFSVLAEDMLGHRWIGCQLHDSYQSAKAEMRYHLKTIANLPIDGMNDYAMFMQTEPCYGSAAWGPANEANLAAFDYDDSDPRHCSFRY